MGNFTGYFNNYSQRQFFESHYEDVSEPLKEYNVGNNGSMAETQSSESLLGVKINGKWGWVNSNNMFIIQPIYDAGFVTCYNGIILLQKNGKWGGIFRASGSTAFSFDYHYLDHAHGSTYVVQNSFSKCALVKPGDRFLTGFDYIGFSVYHQGSVTEFVKPGFFGFGESRGHIDLETGREL